MWRSDGEKPSRRGLVGQGSMVKANEAKRSGIREGLFFSFLFFSSATSELGLPSGVRPAEESAEVSMNGGLGRGDRRTGKARRREGRRGRVER